MVIPSDGRILFKMRTFRDLCTKIIKKGRPSVHVHDLIVTEYVNILDYFILNTLDCTGNMEYNICIINYDDKY